MNKPTSLLLIEQITSVVNFPTDENTGILLRDYIKILQNLGNILEIEAPKSYENLKIDMCISMCVKGTSKSFVFQAMHGFNIFKTQITEASANLLRIHDYSASYDNILTIDLSRVEGFFFTKI